METQVQPSGDTQVQPSHPIHQEQATIERLTKWVGENPDNDPHKGTELEAPSQPEASPDVAPQPVEAPAPAEDGEITEDSPIFDVRVKTEDGEEEKKLSLKELREGYMRLADYTRKTKGVKAQEEAVAKQVEQKSLEAAQAYAQQLELQKQLVLKTVAPELAGVDLNKLAAEDPAEAQRIFFKQIQLNQTLQAIQAEQQKVFQEFEAKRRDAVAKQIQDARSSLERDIKGWDDKVYQTVLQSMVKDYGLEQNAVAQVVDAGLIKVFHDAHQYRQLQKAKPEVEKKVVAVPKVVKPGTGEKPNPASGVADELMAKAKKSGDVRDMALAYLARQKANKKGI